MIEGVKILLRGESHWKKAIWTSAIFLMSGRTPGEQEGPPNSHPCDTVGRTTASNKPHHGEALLRQQPLNLCPQLGTGTHSIMGHLLECIRHTARLKEDQAKVLEANRPDCQGFDCQPGRCLQAINDSKFWP